MPLLRINATSSGLSLHDMKRPVARRLSEMASQPGPAILMLHGYKYAPSSQNHCPHSKIFAAGARGWPAQLGFGGAHDEGLGIAFGWYARGALRAAHDRAAQQGETLAMIVALLRAHRPDRPVHVIAHSLGSEAALSALPHLPRGAIDRMILLTGASFAKQARARLDSPAGRSVEILNVTSRENDLFDAVFERIIRSQAPGDHAIGQGIQAPNVLNLQLDCARTAASLARFGYPLGPSERRVCHWSSYKRQGIMAFYADFLRNPGGLSMARLAAQLPQEAAPRWSRLFSRPVQLPARASRFSLQFTRLGARSGALSAPGPMKNELT